LCQKSAFARLKKITMRSVMEYRPKIFLQQASTKSFFGNNPCIIAYFEDRIREIYPWLYYIRTEKERRERKRDFSEISDSGLFRVFSIIWYILVYKPRSHTRPLHILFSSFVLRVTCKVEHSCDRLRVSYGHPTHFLFGLQWPGWYNSPAT
jgi:hypothetical protein